MVDMIWLIFLLYLLSSNGTRKSKVVCNGMKRSWRVHLTLIDFYLVSAAGCGCDLGCYVLWNWVALIFVDCCYSLLVACGRWVSQCVRSTGWIDGLIDYEQCITRGRGLNRTSEWSFWLQGDWIDRWMDIIRYPFRAVFILIVASLASSYTTIARRIRMHDKLNFTPLNSARLDGARALHRFIWTPHRWIQMTLQTRWFPFPFPL